MFVNKLAGFFFNFSIFFQVERRRFYLNKTREKVLSQLSAYEGSILANRLKRFYRISHSKEIAPSYGLSGIRPFLALRRDRIFYPPDDFTLIIIVYSVTLVWQVIIYQMKYIDSCKIDFCFF